MTRRGFIISMSSVVIVLGGVIVLFSLRQESTESAEVTSQRVKVEKVVQDEVVEVSGNVEPGEEQTLTMTSGGEVKQVYVEEGDMVEKGEVILRLDDDEEQYEYQQAVYELDQKKGTISTREEQLLEMRVKLAKKALEERVLIAPLSGLLVDFAVKPGDRLVSNELQSLGRIIRTDFLRATVQVDELDLGKVNIGQKVRILFDAFPDVEVEGRVEDISETATVDSQGIAVCDVDILIPDPPEGVKPGFSFTGQIVVKEAEELLLLDKRAVITREGRTIVMRVSPEGTARPMPQEVQVEEFDEDRVRVLSGLEEGDEVLILSSSETSGSSGGGSRMFFVGPGVGGPPPGGAPGPPPGGAPRREGGR